MKKLTLFFLSAFFLSISSFSQKTKPVQGISDRRAGVFLFRNATIIVNYQTQLDQADMIIKKDKIVKVGKDLEKPDNASAIDLDGKYIYPSLIDLDSDYGMPEEKKPTGDITGQAIWTRRQQFEAKTTGAFNWNDAIKPQFDASEVCTPDETSAKEYRELGFGTILSHKHDGIARGTSALICLVDDKPHNAILKAKAASHYSFNKGSSEQSYPGSLMGSIALLRQSYLDAEWYSKYRNRNFTDHSLEAWIENQELPAIFEVTDKLNLLRADRIGDEFGVQYIIKGNGDEYQMMEDIKKTQATLIIPVNFPEAIDVSDPNEALMIPLETLKHWELAPYNPHLLQNAGISFAITTSGLKSKKTFMTNLRKAMQCGLSEQEALKALTYTPASMIGMENQIGSLKEGYTASFLIASGNLFDEDCVIHENWVKGEKYVISDMNMKNLAGKYNLRLDDKPTGKLIVSGKPPKQTAEIVINDTVKIKVNLKVTDNNLALSFKDPDKKQEGTIRLSGWIEDKKLSGTGEKADGSSLNWIAEFVTPEKEKKKESKAKDTPTTRPGEIIHPFVAYGYKEKPEQSHLLFKNATVWTNEETGILKNTDVLVQEGKIMKVGKELNANGAEIIDATGKHITAGIIDEHSHIAISGGVNEATNSITSEVRIGDVLNHEDINIYRQLSGGVTSAQILHGSANPIGGQSAVIKHRWGAGPEELKLKGAGQFLKHALGENVKQSRIPSYLTSRYPQTRMGVEQIIKDAYTRGHEYIAEWDKYNGLNSKMKVSASPPRRDLALEAIADLLQRKSYITVHTYVQSETNMIMKLAEEFGIVAHTLIHNTEGYKIADKMRDHGAAGSIFSDWWAFKFEVYQAIPYNAALHLDQNVLTCIHSDNAELSRRLHQEAAKAVKYGGVSEEEAFKLVTLNPAKILHIDDRCGSIKEGKDADLVLWSGHPLSIYTKAEKTLIDGIVYFDIEKDKEMQDWIRKERARIIEKMMAAKEDKKPADTSKANQQYEWDDEEILDFFKDNETNIVKYQY